MATLFPIEKPLPPGFIYEDDFISQEEETDLLHAIETIELHTFMFQGYEAKRKVKSFGYDYSFDSRKLTRGEEIPRSFEFLVNRVASRLQIVPEQFSELLVTEYPVGALINWHRDAPPFDIIAGISLVTDCVFKLRPQEKEKQGRGSIVSLQVKPRSLYIMQGEARTDWQHSTSAVKATRYSITLRTIRKKQL